MVELSSTTALMLYLILTLGTLLALWITHHYRHRYKKVQLQENELIVCEYCNFAYLGNITKPVTQCPQCHSFNKKGNQGKG